MGNFINLQKKLSQVNKKTQQTPTETDIKKDIEEKHQDEMFMKAVFKTKNKEKTRRQSMRWLTDAPADSELSDLANAAKNKADRARRKSKVENKPSRMG